MKIENLIVVQPYTKNIYFKDGVENWFSYLGSYKPAIFDVETETLYQCNYPHRSEELKKDECSGRSAWNNSEEFEVN